MKTITVVNSGPDMCILGSRTHSNWEVVLKRKNTNVMSSKLEIRCWKGPVKVLNKGKSISWVLT